MNTSTWNRARVACNVSLGRMLLRAKEDKEYESYGGWQQMMGDPDIAINATFAHQCMKVVRVFLIQWGMEEHLLYDIPWEKLAIAADAAMVAEDMSEVTELVCEAGVLSKSDLIILVDEKVPKKGNGG